MRVIYYTGKFNENVYHKNEFFVLARTGNFRAIYRWL